MRLAVDLDSTLYPLIEAINSLDGCAHITHESTTTWDSLYYQLGESANRIFMEAASYATMQHHNPFVDSVDVLHRLRQLGLDFVLISDRIEESAECATQWLLDHGFEFAEIHVYKMGSKLSLAQELDAVGILDDKPDTLLEFHKAGLFASGIRFKYNEHVESEGIRLASDWLELEGLVSELL
jgi:hypothetical protein